MADSLARYNEYTEPNNNQRTIKTETRIHAWLQHDTNINRAHGNYYKKEEATGSLSKRLVL
jgi:hypothetical protein